LFGKNVNVVNMKCEKHGWSGIPRKYCADCQLQLQSPPEPEKKKVYNRGNKFNSSRFPKKKKKKGHVMPGFALFKARKYKLKKQTQTIETRK
jgi:hypothetical protein